MKSKIQLRSFQIYCLLMIFFIPIISLAQEFKINGNFQGQKTEEIVLTYYNKSNEPVVDTMEISNGKFKTTGTIGGVQQVYIIGNTSSKYMDDPNIGFFFLEPGELEISLVENHFKEVKIKGSPTQTEYEKLDKGQVPLRQEMDSISKNLTAIVAAGSGSNNEEKSKLEEQWQKNLNKLKKKEIDYAYNNPNSFLSAYYGNFYKRDLPKDSLSLLYDHFTPKVRNTVYAEAIRKLTGKTPVVSNMEVITFKSKNTNGKTVSLEDFKGNYLLLDFWAGWCKPCLANHPTLKEIYQEYNSKGLEILGVSFDASEEEWRESIAEENLDLWQHVYVGLDKVRMEGSISSLYGVQPIPAYILLDKDGVVVERYMAAHSSRKSFEDLKNRLDELLK